MGSKARYHLDSEEKVIKDTSFFLEIMTGFLSVCLSFSRAKFPQEVYCTIESWGDTNKRSVCLKSINGLLNH